VFDGVNLNGPGKKVKMDTLTVHKGTFIEGHLFGKGTETVYEDKALTKILQVTNGEFKNNLVHGQARIERREQKIRNPNSIVTSPENMIAGLDYRTVISIYEGECQNGLRHGKGVFVFKYYDTIHKKIQNQMNIMTQQKYVGEFAFNKPNGYGTMYYTNGNKYVGFFKEGVKQGLGMEVNELMEAGKPKINKGIFEGDLRIGPNWA